MNAAPNISCKSPLQDIIRQVSDNEIDIDTLGEQTEKVLRDLNTKLEGLGNQLDGVASQVAMLHQNSQMRGGATRKIRHSNTKRNSKKKKRSHSKRKRHSKKKKRSRRRRR